MNQVEIKATIDANNPQQVAAAISFLTSLGNNAELPQSPGPAPVKKEAPKKAAPKKAAPAKKETPKKETPAKEEASEETAKEESTSDVKIEDVRALLAKKVNDHRTEIKAKLTELGANNVTSLDKAKYPEFTDFLNNL